MFIAITGDSILGYNELWENLNIHIVPLLTGGKDDYYLKRFKRDVQVIVESWAWNSILVEKKISITCCFQRVIFIY